MLAQLPDYPVPLKALPPRMRLRIVAPAAAGFPSPAQDWEEDAIDLARLLRLDRPGSFVFKLAGNSMIEAGLHDGDIVVVDRDVTPRNGSIVVAVVDGGFVCRQLVVRDGVPTLEARNSRMRYPIVVVAEDVEIWGVVRVSVRDFQL